MKKVRKTTSTILLAGTIALGGLVANGLSVEASSFNVAQDSEIQKVKFYCKGYDKIHVGKSEKEFDDILKGVGRTQIANNGRNIEIKNPAQIPTQLQDAKRYNKKFVKIKCRELFYLIEIN